MSLKQNLLGIAGIALISLEEESFSLVWLYTPDQRKLLDT